MLSPNVTILACGGASWSRLGSDGKWAQHLPNLTSPFAPSNAALTLNWSKHMQPHFGSALKSVRWSADSLSSRGEAIVSERGLEGGGLYPLTPALRKDAQLTVDLLPDLSHERLISKLPQNPKKARLSHWLKNTLRLPPVKVALFHEMTKSSAPMSQHDWITTLKSLCIADVRLRPIDEAISTAGGLRFDALDNALMLTSRPGTFACGEMLDWEAPTGGYLLTACLATGRWAGLGAVRYLESKA